ncbi:hypothetical protein HKCCSP123_00690 [Rhodobacterales bacterium HKCCSP123]|nr:hypothetical protein [Rhodobacterales bacterium HKCCSP123]
MTRPASVLRAITAMMETQREALLAGDFAGLDGMQTRLAQAVDGLAGAGLSRDDLAGIAALAARNARLLDAARAGVTRARTRTRPGSAAGLTTYDSRGRQQVATLSGQTLSRR